MRWQKTKSVCPKIHVCHSCQSEAEEGLSAAVQSAVWRESANGVWGINRQRIDCRRQHWTEWKRTNGR